MMMLLDGRGAICGTHAGSSAARRAGVISDTQTGIICGTPPLTFIKQEQGIVQHIVEMGGIICVTHPS